MADRLSKATQQNVITLLTQDDQNCRIIRNIVDTDLFEGVYNQIAERSYEYIDNYGEAPKDHLPDLFEDILEGKDKRKANSFARIFDDIFEFADRVSAEFTISQIKGFVRRQQLKSAVMRSAEILQGNYNDDEATDQVENLFNSVFKDRVETFDPGARFSDTDTILDALEEDEPAFETGVKELDQHNLGPKRGSLHIAMGLYGSGKTYWLINITRRNVIQRYKVLHISLEMPEKQIIKRYIQAFFSLPKRREETVVPKFVVDDEGMLDEIKFKTRKPKRSLADKDIREHIKFRIGHFGARFHNLIVKHFPSGTLTIGKLEAYLDNLEFSLGWQPDLIVLDYADIMKIKSVENKTDELENNIVNLRRIAEERNCGMATVQQSNRQGESSKTLTGGKAAGAWAKNFHADDAITLNKTDAEKKLGLGRIYVDKARNDKDGFQILITQDLDRGRFCSSSVRLPDRYWGMLKELSSGEDDEEENDG